MKHSKWLKLGVLAVATVCVAGAAVPTEETNAGWVRLFDGKTLTGWTPTAKNQTVKVTDGEIHLLSKKANLWLVHKKSYDHFELEVEAKMPLKGYNSGIGFRCTPGRKKPKGYQCEIDRKKTGQIYAIGKGWVWPKNKEEKARFEKMAGDCFKDGQWNRFRIRCVGKKIQIRVNGVLTADLEDGLFSSGVVALQHHGKGEVHRFRNIRIRPLNADGTVAKP
ncbi:MAG: DUF1080 domain-containing protein [Phycisphaeraceae bacterium]|nr:DUF1080 domain-containing protein [Phycisphaeraceae bacterium]